MVGFNAQQMELTEEREWPEFFRRFGPDRGSANKSRGYFHSSADKTLRWDSLGGGRRASETTMLYSVFIKAAD